jgi:uncharacterized protein
MAATNPFQYTKPVGAGDLIDRGEETAELLRLAVEGNNARVVAPRRYGKTSLLAKVQSELDPDHWVTVYVDLFGIVTLDDFARRIERAYTTQLTGRLARWWTGVVRTLRPTLTLGGGPLPVTGRIDPVASGSESLLDRLALPRRIWEKHGLRVHIVFDEFQELAAVAGHADAVLRSEIQHHGEYASYVFAGSHVGMMEMLFADRSRAFYGQSSPVRLSPLPPDELAAYVDGRFEATGKQCGTDAMGGLLDLVDGHPQRSILAAHALWDATGSGERAGLDAWESARARIIGAVNDEMVQLWGDLVSGPRHVLADIAAGLSPYSSGRSSASRGGAVRNALLDLEGRGLVVQLGSGRGSTWRIVDPLLRQWILDNR